MHTYIYIYTYIRMYIPIYIYIYIHILYVQVISLTLGSIFGLRDLFVCSWAQCWCRSASARLPPELPVRCRQPKDKITVVISFIISIISIISIIMIVIIIEHIMITPIKQQRQQYT